MKATKFIEKYLPVCEEIEKETDIPAIGILAQAALESGWGEKAIGNNLFGIKYRKGDWGKQEVLTTEYFDNRKDFQHLKPLIVEYHLGINKFKVVTRLDFADYETPQQSFEAHFKLLLTDRYRNCLLNAKDPKKYMYCIWKAGYATAPDYDIKINGVIDSIYKRLNKKV